MTAWRANIVLVGMPACGKSTVGVLLAKRTGLDFVDSDVLIQVRRKQTLQQIIAVEGPLGLRRIEAQVLMDMRRAGQVIATGGSAVYSAAAMRHLDATGCIVFLDLDLDELERRLGDFTRRGIARMPGQTLADLYRERLPLYRRYARQVVDCRGLTHEATVSAVMAAVYPENGSE